MQTIIRNGEVIRYYFFPAAIIFSGKSKNESIAIHVSLKAIAEAQVTVSLPASNGRYFY